MKDGKTFMKRFLALALVAGLLLSNLSGLSMLAVAADDSGKTSTTIAQIVADNYDLTKAEVELLKSGYIVSDEYTYVTPTADDDLITVDTDAGKITAKSYDAGNGDTWVPTQAVIEYGSNKLTVALTDGKGTYDVATVGNSFSVKVKYVLTTTVKIDVQKKLLAAGGYLKQGVANIDAVSGQSGNLFILEQAMPQLVDLADNGIPITIAGNIHYAEIEDEAVKDAIYALNNQMTANNGVLNLSAMITAYDGGSKTGYVVLKGAGMLSEINTLTAYTESIGTFVSSVATSYGSLLDSDTKTQLNKLASVLATMTDSLENVASDSWTAANMGTELVYANADYAKLDKLVAALGETTVVTVKETLTVDTTEIQYNLSMWNVTVKVALNTVNSNNTVAEYASKSIVLTLGDGATKDDILAAVKESGIEAAAIAAWGDAYVSGQYEAAMTTLPNTLTKDITYTITYAPKNYTVTIAGEAASYPYGYKLVLPKHSDATKAYDYYAGSVYYAQGTVITVENDLSLTRKEGTAYATGNLLDIIADNIGNEKLTAILSSGALLVNENVNYRQPSDLNALVTLSGNTLTVKTYPSDYEGLSWAPYSYVVDGGSTKLFNGADEVTISGDFEKVDVYYRLTLTNYTAAEVQEILDLVQTMVDEAKSQKTALDRLSGGNVYSNMGSLNKNMLNGLSGMIGGYISTEGGGLHADTATNDALVAYFQDTVAKIVKECVASDGNLKLYNSMTNYLDANNGGLAYYYHNDATIRAELALLSGYLSDMLSTADRKAALVKLLTDMNYGDYVEKIESLESTLVQINANLTPVNAAINTESANLRKLAAALTAGVDLTGIKVEKPYVEMGPVTKTADKYVSVSIEVVISNKIYKVPAVTVVKAGSLTSAQVAELKAQIAAIVNGAIDVSYYKNDYTDGAELDALVGRTLSSNVSYTYTWTAKEYIVKVPGAEDQSVTIEDLTITLPDHTVAGKRYAYTIGGVTVKSGSYEFTADQLDSLFVNNTLTVIREEINEAVEKLEKWVTAMNTEMGYEALTLVEKDGEYTGINVNISANDLMNFVMALATVQPSYSYIGLNDEALMDNAEISIQTLINAVLSDNAFGSETIIALGENGKGTLLNASLQLGNDASDIQYEDLDFRINLTAVPKQLTTAAEALDAVKQYVTFQSNNGTLSVELDLPDPVYGIYMTALLTTGTIKEDNINALNQGIAMAFLYDYLEAVITSDMDAETFTNSLEMMGLSYDLTNYNNYYNYFCKFMNDSTTVSFNEDGMSLGVSVDGKTAINALLNLVGMSTEELSNYLTLLKEYKDGATINADVFATLTNPSTYNAMIADIEASGVKNKYDCTSSYAALAAKLKALTGYSAVTLLDNVTGNLTISGTTILDLNGHTVTGSITSTGKLYIIDSSMDTYNAGTVTGAISGDVVILGGNYKENVSDYLQNGYYQDGTTVRNELYYITEENGNVAFVINTDALIAGNIPAVRAMAMDIVCDLLLNYYPTADLTVDGNDIYGIEIKDLLGLLAGGSTADKAINELLGCVDVEGGITDTINTILADLIDFEAIAKALAKNEAVASYKVTVAPWDVTLEHVVNGNYLTANIGSNAELTKNITVSLRLDDADAYVEKLINELKNVVNANQTYIKVDLEQPTYADKKFTFAGSGSAVAVLDMSNNHDYVTMIAVILAYGNADKRADVVAADTIADLIDIINKTTVAEVITALKAMNDQVDFDAMAKTVGINTSASIAELEAIYHRVLVAAGKLLTKLDVTGTATTLGSKYVSSTGYYVFSKLDIFKNGDIAAKGYSALFELALDELTLKIRLVSPCEDHQWGDWIISKEATCKEEGEKYHVCQMCNEIETSVIQKTAHSANPDNEDHWLHQENGKDWLVCPVCGEKVDERDCTHVHNEHTGNWVETKAPTCTEAGEETRVCGVCGKIETRTVEALGHAYGEWETVKEATEDEPGLKVRKCTREDCDHQETKEIPTLPKTGDIIVIGIGVLALIALLGIAVVELGFKRRLLK